MCNLINHYDLNVRTLMSRKPIKTVIRAVLTLSLFSAVLAAQSIQLTIPDTAAKKGDTLRIPILTSTIALTDSVYSGQITFLYSTSVLAGLSVDTTGTLLGGFGTILFNPTTQTFGFAGTSRLAGNGVLFYLKGLVVGNPETHTAISTSAASFNEGKPSVSVVAGALRVLAIQLSPHSPPTNIFVGDSVQFSVSLDVHPPLHWSVLDTVTGSIDTTGEFRALAPGQEKVYVRDSLGLRDSTVLFGIYPFQGKSLTMSVHDTSYTQTLSFDLPIYISNVTGLGILSSQFSLTFNSSMLQALGVYQSGSKTATWGSPAYNITAGRVDIALAGADTLSGAGVLVYVKFRVQPNASGSAQIVLSNVLFNENLNANTVNGTFTALTSPVLVVSPSSAIRVVTDTLRFSVTSGGKPPYHWSTSNPSLASIDSTGLLTALHRGTDTVRVVDSLGFQGSTGSIVINDFNISIPDTGMSLVDTIDVPVMVGNLTGLGVLSFEGRIVYDSTVVRVLSLPTAGTLSSGFQITSRDTLDTLRIAAAGTSELSGGGALMKIRLISVASSVGVTSPLNIYAFKFNEGIPSASLKNGSVTILTGPPVPTLNSPPDSATGLPTSVALVWNVSAGAASYHLQVSTANNFSTTVVDSSGITGTSVTVAGLQLGTTYFWHVYARNAGGTSVYSDVRRFTIASNPAVPVLLQPLNGATGVARNPIFTWAKAANAVSYRIQVATDNAFLSVAQDTSGVSDTMVTIHGLSAKAVYYWHVQSANVLGSSAYASTRSFTTGTVLSIPSVPVLALPANGATGTARNMLFSWYKASEAATYELQLSVDSLFATTAVDSTGISDSTLSVAGLSASTKYFWRVNASNTGGASAFSSVFRFTTGTVLSTPAIPVLASPQNGANGVSRNVRLVWLKSAEAASYRAQLASDTLFASILADSSGIADSSVVFAGLASSTKYFWRVNATNTAGSSAFSAGQSFTTGTVFSVPPVPVLSSPTNNATEVARNARLTWYRSLEASSYRIQVTTDSTFAAVATDTTSSDSTIVINGLSATTGYFWRVSANNALGASAFSAARKFTTGSQTSVFSNRVGIPTEYGLEQNYPNPFNPSTTILYSLSSRSIVRLEVYNILGQRVDILVNAELAAGYYSATWNAAVPSGIYFYRIEAVAMDKSGGSFVRVRKMTLVR